MNSPSRRRGPFDFFANPFVILADVMVSLVFIISLFLLSTTVYSEQMELIAQRDARRQKMARSLSSELRRDHFIRDEKPVGTQLKYQLGNVLEVEDDGTIQRFRFLSGRLDFQPDSARFKDPARAAGLLEVFGRVLLQNRERIKSIVIEGHAAPEEKNVWQLSLARAEAVRALWTRMHILEDVTEDYNAPIFRFLSQHKLWNPHRFHEWHLQEYAARRRPFNDGLGVIPSAWVIASGRGDQVRRLPVVEFKIEYTERDAPPLDEFLHSLSPAVLEEAVQAGLTTR